MPGVRERCRIGWLALLAGLWAGAGHATPLLDDKVTLAWEETDDGGYRLLATNHHVIPMYLRVAFRELTGLEAKTDLPLTAVLAPDAREEKVLRLHRTTGERAAFESSTAFSRGDPERAEHDDGHRYLLPFAHGEKYRVTQGYHGDATHQGEHAYAVDFDMPEGTPVHAARGGIVVETRADATEGGRAGRFREEDDGNYILIAHDDGTFASYAHLRHGGVAVEVGDTVSAGDHIGYSGNTGYSSGPHLHFDVRKPTRDGELRTVPTRFRSVDGAVDTLEEGRFYYARHPGEPAFDPVLGAELENADFADHRESVTTGEVDVRAETEDLTTILFLRNGTDERLRIETTLELQGMEATTQRTVERVVPPETEVFLTLLRPREGVRSYQYGYRIAYQRAPE